jgi:hypothetical protein
MTIANFIKFHGNSKYFAGLAQTDNDKYILVYGLIGKMNIKNEIINDETGYGTIWIPTLKEQITKVEIPFIANDSRHLFTLITLHNKEEYDTILSLLEVIYGK